jgi:hypothetical protein
MELKVSPLADVSDANSQPIDVLESAERGMEQTPLSENRSEVYGSRDPNIVDWDGPDDLENPTNWKVSKVVTVVMIVSIITFLRYVERTHSWSI